MSPEDERSLRDLARAGREITAIRGLDPNHRERIGATIGDLDQVAESALIRREQWAKPRGGDFERFIRKNFNPDDHVAIGRIQYEGGKPTMRQAILPAEELVSYRWQQFLKAANVNGQNIHISLNTYQPSPAAMAGERATGGRTKADLKAIRHVAIEIDKDGKAAVDRIAQSGPPPHHVVESSPGKFHVWWRVQGFETGPYHRPDIERAEQATRGLIKTFGGDPAASDVTRMLRAPGFTNRKPEYAGLERPHWVREVGRTDDKHLASAQYPAATFAPYMEIGRDRLQMPALERGQSHGRSGVDRSAEDWKWVHGELSKGRDPGSIATELAHNRSDKPNPGYYANHTIERALEARQNERTYKR